MTRRKLPPIVWKKPVIQGEKPPMPMLAVDGLGPRHKNRFWNAFTLGFVLTPLAFLSLCLVDGHWWKGNLSGSVAALLLSITALPLGICIVSCWLLVRRGRTVTHQINARNAVYVETKVERANELRRAGIWKLLGSGVVLIILELILWRSVARILAGLPLLDPSGCRYQRRRHLYDFMDVYLPRGPLAPILLMLFLAAAILFVMHCLWLVLRYSSDSVSRHD